MQQAIFLSPTSIILYFNFILIIYLVDRSPPIAIIVPDILTVDDRSNVSFQCQITGANPISITWRSIPDNTRIAKVVASNQVYLNLSNVHPTDSGYIQCAVSNPYGSYTAFGSLKVNGEIH